MLTNNINVYGSLSVANSTVFDSHVILHPDSTNSFFRTVTFRDTGITTISTNIYDVDAFEDAEVVQEGSHSLLLRRTQTAKPLQAAHLYAQNRALSSSSLDSEIAVGFFSGDTLEVGNLSVDTEYTGRIFGYGTDYPNYPENDIFRKIGNGNFCLVRASDYKGPTIVNNGSLTVTGSIDSGTTLTVASGAFFNQMYLGLLKQLQAPAHKYWTGDYSKCWRSKQ